MDLKDVTPQQLLTELELAQVEYTKAADEETQARSRKCGALNRLNAAQKAVDAWTAKLRADAPRDSDWKQEQRRRESVPIP